MIQKQKTVENGTAEKMTAEIIAGTLAKSAMISRKSLVADKKMSDEERAERAYRWLEASFKRHITNFAIEAGRYIIDTFYRGDPCLAFKKNKTKYQPPSLKMLIKKIQETSKSPSKNVPSVSWFYRAVGLASQEMIGEQMGFSTLRILGHSHKMELLNVPKIKQIPADKFDEAIRSIFEQKEKFAKEAVDKDLSVREFRAYIRSQTNGNGKGDRAILDLANLPPRKALEEQDPKKIRALYNDAKQKIEESQKAVRIYGKALNKLGAVWEIVSGSNGNGKGRFQDLTKPGNNVNICSGCKNDCLYCYMKPIFAKFGGKKGKKLPEDWHKWELRPDNVKKKQNLKDGLVCFPSSHDIFPEILDEYLEVLGKLLRAGNEVLIFSKPHVRCIQAILNASTFFKDKILFRFTIGAKDDEILSFWEPNAPNYLERKECLFQVHDRGFRTSVSIEPMLDTSGIKELVSDLEPCVTEDIWLGQMTHLNGIKNWSEKEGFEEQKERIAQGQTPERLAEIYDIFKDNQKIKWNKDTLKVIHKWNEDLHKGKAKKKIKIQAE